MFKNRSVTATGSPTLPSHRESIQERLLAIRKRNSLEIESNVDKEPPQSKKQSELDDAPSPSRPAVLVRSRGRPRKNIFAPATMKPVKKVTLGAKLLNGERRPRGRPSGSKNKAHRSVNQPMLTQWKVGRTVSAPVDTVNVVKEDASPTKIVHQNASESDEDEESRDSEDGDEPENSPFRTFEQGKRFEDPEVKIVSVEVHNPPSVAEDIRPPVKRSKLSSKSVPPSSTLPPDERPRPRPRSFWIPSEATKRLIDAVSITDVTTDALTITVRESTTCDGFFSSQRCDDVN